MRTIEIQIAAAEPVDDAPFGGFFEVRPPMSAFAKSLCLSATMLALAGTALAGSGCSAKREPENWVLWYIPNEPTPGIRIDAPCKTYVFATAPLPDEYVVASIKGWIGEIRPTGNTAVMHAGEVFSGPLDVGSATIDDESNGYTLKVDVVYDTPKYLIAKGRADADCPLVAHTKPPARSTRLESNIRTP